MKREEPREEGKETKTNTDELTHRKRPRDMKEEIALRVNKDSE